MTLLSIAYAFITVIGGVGILREVTKIKTTEIKGELGIFRKNDLGDRPIISS
jgi:hypothetical protein